MADDLLRLLARTIVVALLLRWVEWLDRMEGRWQRLTT